MMKDPKKKNPLLIPPQYRERFEAERLETNAARMEGFAIYIVALQLFLQIANVLFPQHSMGEQGMNIPVIYYILLSFVSLLTGAVYWVLLALVRHGKIKSRAAKTFLVQSLLYLYFVIQMAFCTLNILTHQGINGQFILVLLLGVIPVLRPLQSAVSILASFLYTMLAMLLTRNITDASGVSQWTKFFQSDMRAYLFIVNGLTIVISIMVYRLYVSNFLKSMALEEYNANLEALIQKRTGELAEKTRAAEAASAAKSRFLTSMSHEIRTPLNAVMGMAQIAKKAETKEKADSSIEQILSASDHLLGILNDILDMSNIESGRMKIENERFVLSKTVNAAVNIIRERCAYKGIAFTYRCNTGENDPLAVIGDKLRVRQVLINILGNAVKFTPEDGRVDFEVTVADKTETDVGVSFRVADTGIGITSGQKQRLFIPFEQGSVNSMKHGGTGLGLAISRSLVTMMGGEITVESEPGKGSVFTFNVTFQKAPALEEGGKPAVPDLAGRHILSVEDIEINRLILRELLEETNAVVEDAADGAEAVKMFAESAEGYYDFVFMDLLMPNMNGFDAAKAIRSLDRPDARNVPIIALSANAYQEDVDAAKTAGMNDHLAKPVDFTALTAMLAEHIQSG